MAVFNVLGDLRERMSHVLDCDCVVQVPDERPKRLVAIKRQGGARENALIDRAGIHIYCWGESELDAMRLSDIVDDFMLTLKFADGYDSVVAEGRGSSPDPDTREPRWFNSYTVKTHYIKE